MSHKSIKKNEKFLLNSFKMLQIATGKKTRFRRPRLKKFTHARKPRHCEYAIPECLSIEKPLLCVK